jgi:hypothetical protein
MMILMLFSSSGQQQLSTAIRREQALRGIFTSWIFRTSGGRSELSGLFFIMGRHD